MLGPNHVIRGLITFHVYSNGLVHPRYGEVYRSLDPKQQDTKWVKDLKLHIEREAKKWIADHQKDVS